MRLTHQYRILPGTSPPNAWDVTTVGYHYTLEDLAGQEIVSYHWHPEVSSITWPHLHLGAALGPSALSRAHLPTGQVAIEDVLALAIRDLSIQPLRDDWAAILGVAKAGRLGG